MTDDRDLDGLDPYDLMDTEAGRLGRYFVGLDETTWSRELAPLAGFYPSVFVGAPWWFLDTPSAMLRFREAVTDTAGFCTSAPLSPADASAVTLLCPGCAT